MRPASTGTLVVFVGIVLGLVMLLVLGVARPSVAGEPAPARRRWAFGTALGALTWLGVTALVPLSGVLEKKVMPPPVLPFVFVCMAVAAVAALSPLGTRLIASTSIAWLVGFQTFRLPLELVLHWQCKSVIGLARNPNCRASKHASATSCPSKSSSAERCSTRRHSMLVSLFDAQPSLRRRRQIPLLAQGPCPQIHRDPCESSRVRGPKAPIMLGANCGSKRTPVHEPRRSEALRTR